MYSKYSSKYVNKYFEFIYKVLVNAHNGPLLSINIDTTS